MKKFGVFLLALLIFSGFNSQPVRTITGRVTTAGQGTALPGVAVSVKGTSTRATTDQHGKYTIAVPDTGGTLVFSLAGFNTQTVPVGKSDVINVSLTAVREKKEEDVVHLRHEVPAPGLPSTHERTYDRAYSVPSYAPHPEVVTTEEYEGIEENIFHGADKKPLSTFSIDVDAASYSNVRRFINNGQRPPKDAVRIEEMINYFDYDYRQPDNGNPFSVYTELAPAPWNSKHYLLHIGLQGRKIATEKLPPSNLVFLVDVSGSMNQPNKLPLMKKSFQMLVDQLRPQDHVAMVVYAGAAGTVLEPTSGGEKQKILTALDNLQAGGSTAGGAGLTLAYALARQHFKKNGNNRVIIATDGDFNVGESSNDAMQKLVEEKRKEGTFLTVLGFGMGNLKDSKMEILADKGNGNYAYIDNLSEARKVLVNEFGGTLFTIANDVKIQVEFNPAKVQAYRLIGYENRKLNDEDFNNDRKDAGEIGAGHTVTALYEIIPAGVKSDFYSIDPLKYQPAPAYPASGISSEWLTLKLRYKDGVGDKSKLLVHTVKGNAVAAGKTSEDFRWSAAVAAFGMLLRESPHVTDLTYTQVAEAAAAARGADPNGYRSEFINLVRSFDLIAAH